VYQQKIPEADVSGSDIRSPDREPVLFHWYGWQSKKIHLFSKKWSGDMLLAGQLFPGQYNRNEQAWQHNCAAATDVAEHGRKIFRQRQVRQSVKGRSCRRCGYWQSVPD